MTEAQALQVVDYWCRIASNADRFASEQDRHERERFDAFGPRPPRPWESEAATEDALANEQSTPQS